MNETVLTEEMTWPKIKQAVENGKTTVIVVSGAIEQHGPHLPTATDTILGYEIARRTALKLGTALVAPVIRPALSEHHLGFPGSFALALDTYQAVLKDYCRSLVESGFKDIVLISSHGGNSPTLTSFTPYLAKMFLGSVAVHLVDNLKGRIEKSTAFLDTLDISRAKAGVHSGYAETSMMLAVAPHLVHMEKAEPGLVDESFYEPENIPRSQIDSLTLGIAHFSPNGILGDPRGANAAAGERLLEIAVDALVEAIENLAP